MCNKKEKIIVLAFLGAAIHQNCWAENADALEGVYVAVGRGKAYMQGKANLLSNDSKNYSKTKLHNPFVFKAAIGKDFGSFRAEFEFLNFTKAKLNVQETNKLEGMSKKLNMLNIKDFYFQHKATLSSNIYYINAYYNFKELNEILQPYVGFGLGMAHHKLSPIDITTECLGTSTAYGSYPQKTKSNFAFNVSVGTLIKVNKNFFFDFYYKFADLGKINGSSILTTSAKGYQIQTKTAFTKRLRHHIILASIGFKL
jgi:opacity protein-like surface antigen